MDVVRFLQQRREGFGGRRVFVGEGPGPFITKNAATRRYLRRNAEKALAEKALAEKALAEGPSPATRRRPTTAGPEARRPVPAAGEEAPRAGRAADGPRPPKAKGKPGALDEQALRARYAADEKLQAEFADVECFVAFERAVLLGVTPRRESTDESHTPDDPAGPREFSEAALRAAYARSADLQAAHETVEEYIALQRAMHEGRTDSG